MDPLVIGEKLTKSYGLTVAVDSVSFAIRRGAITALLGGNGAGKNTRTRLLSGGARPDNGTLTFDSHPISLGEYSVRKAKDLGIRVVHQKLSLCTNLNAAENFFLELSGLFSHGPWRRKAGALVEKTLEAIFPENRVRASSNVGSLSLAQQQMVEIAAGWREEPELGAVKLFRGDIVRLEGSGQEPLLLGIYAASTRSGAKIIRRSRIAYVAGDRQKEGVFPLWTTMQNMTIARQARRGGLQPVSVRAEKRWAEPWRDRFSFTASAMERPVLQLSGGNQQKALMSRALIDQADVILLNDPTRGVDIGVKREFYQVLRDVAASGKLVWWYSSEDSEFMECSRVLVLRRGDIATEISGQEATRENLVAAFFGSPESRAEVKKPQSAARAVQALPGWLVPLAALAIMLVAIGLFNPRALSPVIAA